MTQQEKDRLLEAAKNHLQGIRQVVAEKLKETQHTIQSLKEKLSKIPSSEVPTQISILKQYARKSQELETIYPSPYFIKCEIRFDHEKESRIFYFSKYSLTDQNMYSWVSPAAAIRFEKPGNFSYAIPGFENKSGELLAKEQYMITGGKILFMAAESLTQPRELIYQEYFSQRKTNFVLPEIVEQMEKSQDKVIRANPYGSFLISGPAGSGKTTLALHRVAYLVQSPETAETFKEESVVVFVQDAGTREYFAGLLPQLGIHNVTITTFSDWAREQLSLFDFSYTIRFGYSEEEKDLYEYEKYQALKTAGPIKYDQDIFTLLSKAYNKHLSNASTITFETQRIQKTLDRFDLTLLLQSYLHTFGGLFREETEYKQLKQGKVQRKKNRVPVRYSLLIVDEAQNYLPEQIQSFRLCANEKNHSIVYVGDLAQQTQLCTIREWQHAGEDFNTDERRAVLQKNYRSTKQILEYIQSAGFDIPVPDGIKEGASVKEIISKSKIDEISYVKSIAEQNSKTVIGVLAKTADYLTDFKELLSGHSNIHILTINEAQGVEFDIECLVGISETFFKKIPSTNSILAEERKRVDRDLIYVALTRAMNELHVLGDTTIKNIFN
jgi:DNA helicase IV